eukprot:7388164-Prymnesium_polylepis.2
MVAQCVICMGDSGKPLSGKRCTASSCKAEYALRRKAAKLGSSGSSEAGSSPTVSATGGARASSPPWRCPWPPPPLQTSACEAAALPCLALRPCSRPRPAPSLCAHRLPRAPAAGVLPQVGELETLSRFVLWELLAI